MEVRTADSTDISILTGLYAQGDKNWEAELAEFWQDWFSAKIPGVKMTLVAIEKEVPIGAVRLWQSPYCDHKWLVEGLEVLESARRRGIGEALVRRGIELLRERGQQTLFAHIHRNNTASINLHHKLGFHLVSEGYINSWGEPRDNGNEYRLKLITWLDT